MPPVNWFLAIERMRRINLRRMKSAGGAITKAISDIIGSWIAMTATSAINVNRSRPNEVTSRLIVVAAACAPIDSRARNSEECRCEKNSRFCWISEPNMRR